MSFAPSLLCVVVAFCFSFAVTAQSPLNSTSSTSPEIEITFGQSAPLTGPSSVLGLRMKAGIQAAFNEMNVHNLIPGIKLRLVSYDDQYEPSKCLNNTKQLITQDKVFGLIGYVGSTSSLTVAPVARAAQVPIVGPLTGARELRFPYDSTLVNLRPGYREEMAAVVNLVVGDYRMNRIACFYQDDDFGIGGMRELDLMLDEVELDLVAYGSYKRNTVDVDAAFKNISSVGTIDVVVLISLYAPAAAFIQRARQHPSFTQDTIYVALSPIVAEAFLESLGSDTLKNIFVTQIVPLPFDMEYEVVRNYQHAMGMIEEKTDIASLEGYVSGRFVGEVLSRMKTITSGDFITTIHTLQYFGTDDLRYGLFGGPCPKTTMLSQQTLCNCSQGGRTVWMTTLNPQSRSYEAVADATFRYPNSDCFAPTSLVRESTAFGIIYPTDGSVANYVGHQRSLGVQMAFQGAKERGADIELQLVVGEDVPTSPSGIRTFMRKNRLVGLISSVIDFDDKGYNEFLMIDPFDPDPAAGASLNQFPSSTFFTTPTLEDEIYALIGSIQTIKPNSTVFAVFRTIDDSFDNNTKELILSWLMNSLDTHTNGTINTTNASFLGANDPLPDYPTDGFVLLVTSNSNDLDPFVKNVNWKTIILLPAWSALAHLVPRNLQSRVLSVSVSDDTVRNVRGRLVGKLRLEFEEDARRMNVPFSSMSDPIVLRGYIAGRLASLLIEHSANRSATGNDIKVLMTTIFTVGVIGHVRLGPYGETCSEGLDVCPCPAGAHSLYVYAMGETEPMYFTQKQSCAISYRSQLLGHVAAPVTQSPQGLLALLPEDTTVRYEIISGFFAAILIVVSLIGCLLYRRFRAKREEREERGEF